MALSTLLLIVAFVTRDIGYNADLIVKPSNMVVTKGKIAILKCSTDNASLKLRWRMSTNNNTLGAVIYTGNKLTKDSPKSCRIETSGRGGFNLLIEANEATASRYNCDEPGGLTASAELIVLASTPLYTYFDHNADAAAETSNKGLHIQMQCYLSYWGNWAPEMEWAQVSNGSSSGGNRIPFVKEDVYHSSSDNLVSTVITIAGNSCCPDISYKCVTRFTATGRPLLTTATNIPDYTFIWSTFICSKHTENSVVEPLAKSTHSKDCQGLTVSLIVVSSILTAIVFLVICLAMKQKRKRTSQKRTPTDDGNILTQYGTPLNEYNSVETQAVGQTQNGDSATAAPPEGYTDLDDGERIRPTTYTQIQLPEQKPSWESENIYSDVN